MFALLIPGILAAMPVAYELDFDAIPLANTGPFRDFVITLSFKGEPDVKLSLGYASKYGPKEMADDFVEWLGDTRWKLKRAGNRIIILGYDEVRTAGITVGGKGPQPLVRKVPNFPPAKK